MQVAYHLYHIENETVEWEPMNSEPFTVEWEPMKITQLNSIYL